MVAWLRSNHAVQLLLIGLKKARLCAGLFCLWIPPLIYGAGDSSAPMQPQTLPADSDEPVIIQGVDQYHQTLTEQIILYSSSVDSFISNERQNIESNHSRLLIGWGETLYEGGEYQGGQILDAKLHLPQLQNRLRIDINIGEEDGRAAEGGSGGTPSDQQQPSKVSVGLGLLMQAKEWINFRLSSGGRLQDNQLSLFATGRLRLGAKMGEWSNHVTGTWERDSRLGTQVNSRLDLERGLTDTLKFRSTTERIDYITASYATASQDLYLFQQLGERKNLIYQLGAYGLRQRDELDMELESYVASIHFRRRIYREWIFLDLIPQRIYARSRDFRPIAALTIRISALIGYQG